jgi:hypothetical protein
MQIFVRFFVELGLAMCRTRNYDPPVPALVA